MSTQKNDIKAQYLFNNLFIDPGEWKSFTAYFEGGEGLKMRGT